MLTVSVLPSQLGRPRRSGWRHRAPLPRSHRYILTTMAERQHPDGDLVEDDDDGDDNVQPSQRERAERAAAAAQARLRGEAPPTATTATTATATTAHEAVTAALNASSAASGVGQVDEATAALAAATLAEAAAPPGTSTSDPATAPMSGAALSAAATGLSQGQGNDLTKSLSEQLECREFALRSPGFPVAPPSSRADRVEHTPTDPGRYWQSSVSTHQVERVVLEVSV